MYTDANGFRFTRKSVDRQIGKTGHAVGVRTIPKMDTAPGGMARSKVSFVLTTLFSKANAENWVYCREDKTGGRSVCVFSTVANRLYCR